MNDCRKTSKDYPCTFGVSNLELKDRRSILICPAMYLKFIQTLSSQYSSNHVKHEERKSKLEKLIQRVEGIEVQVNELKQELKDIHPKIQQNKDNMSMRQETKGQLMKKKAELQEEHKTKAVLVEALKEEVEGLQKSVDDELVELKKNLDGETQV